MTDSREPYKLNQPEHRLANDVLRRIEAICHENGLQVAFGVRVHNTISQLIEQYNTELTEWYDKNGLLDIENQRLRKELKGVAGKARNSQQQGQILIAMMIEEVLAK
jgi:hypothetical protein